MKKIVYMISTMFYPSIGGVENHIYNLSVGLTNKGYLVKIIKPELGCENHIYNLDGIEVHIVGCGNLNDLKKYKNYSIGKKNKYLGFLFGYLRKNYFNKFSQEIYRYIEEDINKNKGNKILIHQHDFISSIKLSKKLSKKYDVIFTNHTGEFLFLKKIPLGDKVIKLLTYHFKKIIAPSEELAEFKGIRNLKTVFYIPNGVDINKFNIVDNKEMNNLRSEYNISNDKLIVLCPRRWAPTKGVIYLIKAICDMKEKGEIDRNLFVFAGNDYNDYPEYKKEINEIIEKNDLHDNILLMGNVDYKNINNLMKLSDVIVFPSLMEAVSLAALEGMACGKIIVGTNIGGFPQLIEDKIDGFLVKSKDEFNLSKRLIEINNNYDKYENIKIKAREKVVNKYSWNIVTEKTIKIYEGCYKYV